MEREPPELPDWISPQQTAERRPTSYKELKALEHQTFSNMMEPTLDKIAAGHSLASIVKDDFREIDYQVFLRWLLKDPARQARYYEAQEMGAEIVADQIITTADAVDSVEDVARSTLRINTRKYMLGVWNKRRFGETKQIEMTGTISITQALAEARGRVIEGVFEELAVDEKTE